MSDITGFEVAATLADGSEFQLRASLSPRADQGEMTRLVTGITHGLRGAGFPTNVTFIRETREAGA
jgi:hypothetical protein